MTMPAAIEAVRDAFAGLAAEEFDLPPRQAFGDSRSLVMAVHHRPTASTAVKVISIEVERDPMITGTLVYSHPDGQFVTDAVSLTSLRTGAVVGVATDLLADEDASHLALLGAGAQAADQVRAVHAVRPLKKLVVFNRNAKKAEALLESLRDELPDTVVDVAAQAEEAVRDADVVCCATASTVPLFRCDALKERVHVNAIGSYRPVMRELPEELLATAGVVVVDQVEAALSEAGEIIRAVRSGVLRLESLVELGAALGNPPLREGRTVFKSVGVAVQDWAVARLLA
ncbi:ornithine cyclodeaminase family protein [Lentzea sp. NEAU-D7]|uniref:ornithine cyclodeaminase family protein n=1 Tax=Lentzea sp. NEAU-D7 TaxID=2994667 RepID=UPI00224AF8A0|nr:ornithine cyclodeaminase family protein [Lentzea sp. NEAU-D7]MCX2949384.1 ornithine cyclodeaminase family protein [Lentzea sp. NEAU-D7]